MAGFGAFLTYLFFLYRRKKKKMKQILNTLTNSDFISKCTNYICDRILEITLMGAFDTLTEISAG